MTVSCIQGLSAWMSFMIHHEFTLVYHASFFQALERRPCGQSPSIVMHESFIYQPKLEKLKTI